MAKSFTDVEKVNIQQKLIFACEESWSRYGYKKTNVDELCKNAGISKGAFYLFYNSKEDLFCETIIMVQNRLYSLVKQTLEDEPTKEGFAKSLKLIYRQYDKSQFLYDTHSTDFTYFTNKLTKEQLNRILENGKDGAYMMINMSNLKLRIEKEKALSILTVLLSTISSKETISYNHFEVFDFLADKIVGEIID